MAITGVTFDVASLNDRGQVCTDRQRFHKVLTTGVKIAAYSFHNQYGMRSSPVAFFLILDREFKT